MHVGIIGGGVAGLGAAFELIQAGHDVTIVEAADRLGGLAGSFDFGGADIERFYHFICKPDVELLQVADELGLGDRITWRPTGTAFYYDGRVYPFGTPLDLLRFKPISFLSRLRFGLNIMYSRSIKYWQQLEGVSAKDWLIRHLGEQAYSVIWHPLLKIKFGRYYDQVAASWMWHRIHRVAQSRDSMFAKEYMGFFTAGSQMLVDAFEASLAESGATVLLRTPVQEITVQGGRATGVTTPEGRLPFDAVLSTGALPLLAGMLPASVKTYRAELERIQYIGVVCMILKLKHPITDYFWLNINDPAISFNGIIEYTNLNPRPDLGGTHIAYIPFYLPTNEARYTMGEQEMFDEYCAAIQRVNPAFTPDWVLDYRVFRSKFAQAICTTGFSRLVPAMRAPVPGLYLTDSTQLYPSDRTISGMIGLGRRAAQLIAQDAA